MSDWDEGTQDGQASNPTSREHDGKNAVKSNRKGKNKDFSHSMLERLQDSGRLAINAVAAGNISAAAALGHKAAAGPSTISGPGSMLGESSSSHRTAKVVEPLKLYGNGRSTSDDFDSFINGRPNGLPSFARQGTQSQLVQSPRESFAEQEAVDGATVVQMLALPNHAADTLPIVDVDEDVLSSAEAARLREALFGSGNANSLTPKLDSLLDFSPGFVFASGPGVSLDAELLLGTTQSALAQSIWLQQWSEVLSSYTDEVWGDLGPLAAEARREIDRTHPAISAKNESKALERLSLILAHVRGANYST
ncbi:hypothetical protein CDD83_6116 [Cordyceps sp. RAO-2017]|nr:hypothetical protein CDD83_6116 [Cordyceps sp. RAO-2017]